jgi:MFS superfamily sulfate permease-like transporter
VQSVPDGLATGLLAGLNPLNGLYGYMVGTIAGAAATSSVFMVVQGTGAMAMVIADMPALHTAGTRMPPWRPLPWPPAPSCSSPASSDLVPC